MTRMLKRISAYILLFITAFSYAYSYNRRFGVTLVLALIITPLVSYIMLRKAARALNVTISLPKEVYSKGEEIDFKITVSGESVFPVPFLFLESHGGNEIIELTVNGFLISVSKACPGCFERRCRAQIWGSTFIGVSNLSARDYLGLFRIIPDIEESCMIKTVSIRPALHEPLKNDLLMFICNEMTIDDKEDEASDKKGFLSQPGYTYRPYAPPDALNRINWKLFAKLDKYMVRENEYIENQTPVIMLDRAGPRAGTARGAYETAALLEERIVEAVLAMLLSMVRQSISCNTYYYHQDTWQEAIINDEDDIAALQNDLALYRFCERGGYNQQRVPIDINRGGGRVMVFTCLPDDILNAQLEGHEAIMVIPDTLAVSRDNVWFVDEAYDFYGV